jgi:antirestriction protein ArdC
MSKVDVYQEVTDRVLAALEAGTAPWRKPWSGASGRPQNMDGRPYRGINLILLAMAGHTTPFWMTYKQARVRGGSVVKGQKSTMVVLWRQIKDREDPDKTIFLLRHFNVFNLDQTEGVTEPERVKAWRERESHPYEEVLDAEAIVKGYPDAPPIEYGTAAFYVPSQDRIVVPPHSAYPQPEEFYSTLFHEMGHSTMHETRLNRKVDATFGCHEYGREELVAEMTASFLCAEAGIESTLDNSAAYLASWMKTIKEDNRAVVVAAGAAQRAADHILARSPKEES